MKKLINQILKFGIVGIIAFLIDYGLYNLLTSLFGINYLISNIISFSVSVIANYILSIIWVFEVNHKQTKKDFIIFVVLSTIGLGINELIMYLMVDGLGLNDKIIKLFATAVVMVYNFITRKIFIEKWLFSHFFILFKRKLNKKLVRYI